MKLTQLDQFQGQILHGSFIGSLCTGCTAAFKQGGQRFKGCLLPHVADPAAAHADSISLLQQCLIPVRKLIEAQPDHPGEPQGENGHGGL